MTSIQATAPLRVDIGGGVTDVPDLGSEVGTAVVNLAIDLYNDSDLRSRKSINSIAYYSTDNVNHVLFNNIELELDALSGELRFVTQLFTSFIRTRHFNRGVTLKISDTLPKGTGLGGSASLSLSIMTSLSRLCDVKVLSTEELVKQAHYFETVEMEVPGGCQDYIAAGFGGLNYIDFSDLPVSRLTDNTALGQKMPESTEAFLNNHMLFIVQRIENIGSGSIVADEIRKFSEDKVRMTGLLDQIKQANVNVYKILTNPNFNELAVDTLATTIHASWEVQKMLTPLLRRTLLRGLEDLVRPYVYALRGPGAGGNSLFLLTKPNRRQGLLRELEPYKDDLIILYGRINNQGLSVITNQAD
jgi:galactokinase/mevalonate kinase-like predicted kinase